MARQQCQSPVVMKKAVSGLFVRTGGWIGIVSQRQMPLLMAKENCDLLWTVVISKAEPETQSGQ